ncbi:hypothetical protein JCM8208_006694 [Rhodotorula glutinis]
MLDQLPDELLLAVMVALDSPSSGTHRYSHRQRDLGALCLVSRRLCRIAQPVLQQQVEIGDNIGQLFWWLNQPDPARGAVRRNARAVTVHEPWTFSLDHVAFLLQLFTSVQELRLVGDKDEFSPKLLSPHSNLRRLCLDGLDLDERDCVALPLLEVLHLRNTYLSDEFMDEWITSASFPSLKAYNPGDHLLPPPTRLLATFSKLELVQCWYPSADYVARHGDGDNPTFLFELDVTTLDCDDIEVLPRHVLLRTEDECFQHVFIGWETDLLEALPHLVKLVKRQPPSAVDGQGGTLILPPCLLDLQRYVDALADEGDGDSDGDGDDALDHLDPDPADNRNLETGSGSDSDSDTASDDSWSFNRSSGSYTPNPRTHRLYGRLVAACARAGRTILYDECEDPHVEYVSETFWAHLRRTRRAREGTTSGREL